VPKVRRVGGKQYVIDTFETRKANAEKVANDLKKRKTSLGKPMYYVKVFKTADGYEIGFAHR
jgi:hypothetical protein